MGRAEVGAVSGEDLDPLVAGRLRCVGDEVGGVVVPAPGHRDIGRGCAGVFPNDQVCGVGGGSLGAIDGAGVGELDVVAHVRGGQDPFAAASGNNRRAVGAEPGHGPGVAVGDIGVAVVAPRRDLVPDPDPFPRPGREHMGVVDVPAGDEPFADGPVEVGHLRTGVGHQQHPAPCPFHPVARVAVAAAAIAARAWVRAAGVG